MSKPSAKTNIVATAIKYLYNQFSGAPVMEAIIASYAEQAQEIEIVLVNVWVLRMLEDAANAQLDALGLIVGEARENRSDEYYKLAIAVRIWGNKSNASIDDVLRFLVAADDREYELIELGQASMLVEALGPIGSTPILALDAVLQKYKGAGVRADLLYHTAANELVFVTAPGDIAEASTKQGTANDARTTGGYLADIVE